MAVSGLSLRAGMTRSWAALPTWAKIAAVYALARLVTVALVLLAAQLAPAQSQLGSVNPLGDFTLAWDAQWYWLVAVEGYPDELPLDENGHVTQNAWAFLPVYAYAAKAMGAVFGGNWAVGAFVVSFVAGYLACLGLCAIIRIRQGRAQAMWAVAFFAFGPLAALFHVGYAESLFLAELFAALLCVLKRRWWWLYLLVPLMAFTRPGLQAFALMLAMYGIWRWFTRGRDPLPARDVVHIVVIGLFAAAAGFAWPAIAGVVTGDPGAYLDTELAWRRGWVGTEEFAPVEGWFAAADVWFAVWGLPAGMAPVAVVALVAALTALVLFLPAVRRVGPELRMWAASYLIYLLLVFFPQSSIFRLMVPLAPAMAGAAVLPGSGRRARLVRAGVMVVCLAGQWAWIWFMWARGSDYWQVP